jgi:uncharacterized repeat protein (TIGR02543 family)
MPYVGHVLNGWVRSYKTYIVTQIIVDHVTQNVSTVKNMRLNLQPLSPEEIRRKPEEERSWKWFSVLVKSNEPDMKVDDLFSDGTNIYRIDSVQPWNETGYRRYHATEYYDGSGAVYSVIYKANGADSGNPPAEYAYQKNATVTVLGKNTLFKTGYTFDGWNKKLDGSGTAYEEDDDIEISTASVTLYAQWSINI